MASGTPNENTPVVSFSLTTAALAQVLDPGPAPNTKTIMVFNRDTADAALLLVQDALLGVPVLTTANSMVLPANSISYIQVGQEGDRFSLTVTPGGPVSPPDRLVVWVAAAAGAPVLNINYVQGRGYAIRF